jgi:hypothetical protein
MSAHAKRVLREVEDVLFVVPQLLLERFKAGRRFRLGKPLLFCVIPAQPFAPVLLPYSPCPRAAQVVMVWPPLHCSPTVHRPLSDGPLGSLCEANAVWTGAAAHVRAR